MAIRFTLRAIRRRHARLTVGAAVVALASAVIVPAAASTRAGAPAAPTGESLWEDSTVPAVVAADDTQAVELGTRFTASVAGVVSGIRFYKAQANTGTHDGSLWAADGTLLARTTFVGETASGWQTAQLSQPVAIEPGRAYEVSYHTEVGRYSVDTGYFAAPHRRGPLTAPADASGAPNGVYRYGAGGFPNQSFRSANYWVDVVFQRSGGPSPSASSSGPPGQQRCPAYPQFPDASCTGPVGTLPLYTGSTQFRTPGQVVENVEIRADDVYVAVDNVTFRNVRIVYTGALDAGFTIVNIAPGVTGTVFEDCEIDGQDRNPRAIKGESKVTVRRCDIHHVGNAVEVGTDFTVEDSYLHDLRTPAGLDWHSDGIQAVETIQNVTVRHNTIFLTGPETGAINIIGFATDTMTNILIQHNLMAGGSYTVYAGAGTTVDYRIVDNHFSTRYYPTVGDFGIWYPEFVNTVVRQGNVIHETGAPADT